MERVDGTVVGREAACEGATGRAEACEAVAVRVASAAAAQEASAAVVGVAVA